VVRVPDTEVQPIAAIEVARLVAAVATSPPANDVVEIAGPDAFAFEDAVARALDATNDRRRVIADPDARYFGAVVTHGVLLPRPDAHIATTRLADWLSRRHENAATAPSPPRLWRYDRDRRPAACGVESFTGASTDRMPFIPPGGDTGRNATAPCPTPLERQIPDA
jgi:hypothetical protein